MASASIFRTFFTRDPRTSSLRLLTITCPSLTTISRINSAKTTPARRKDSRRDRDRNTQNTNKPTQTHRLRANHKWDFEQEMAFKKLQPKTQQTILNCSALADFESATTSRTDRTPLLFWDFWDCVTGMRLIRFMGSSTAWTLRHQRFVQTLTETELARQQFVQICTLTQTIADLPKTRHQMCVLHGLRWYVLLHGFPDNREKARLLSGRMVCTTRQFPP